MCESKINLGAKILRFTSWDETLTLNGPNARKVGVLGGVLPLPLKHVRSVLHVTLFFLFIVSFVVVIFAFSKRTCGQIENPQAIPSHAFLNPTRGKHRLACPLS